MQLYLMRHGEAGHEARYDRERSLTETGFHHTALMSEWLKSSGVKFQLVLVSPYVRAQQTWQEVSSHFPTPRKSKVLDELVPAADPEMAARLVLAYAEQYQAENVLVISHMPLLGYMVSELVPGIEPPLFATSSVAMVDIIGHHSELMWQQTAHSIS
ncbi:phosphohistidine phosphatase SixA [Shewanella yunxiaonensis]|uniref:Phosphohistidine phosphatase SixA n=1 Tax=Shewanella yunxiaonensis TaxID=2829809 RepID=A0ABX7YYC7_9GAMM|nr:MULTISPECIES: phosphohistidine phosphatase SixA [Shewanella]MDF0535435.1 phosphohistidine phosphatase SixA [Shewanella sp. A32]QUN07191.1 phosphohistidine phosphatase SixA [Shewanella yunxiaonensis]